MNDQNPLSFFVTAVQWVLDAVARSLVALFDGARNALDHAAPSLFSLVAVLLPFALPLPVAFLTAHSAETFFEWDRWSSLVLGLGLEGLGLLSWVRLVDVVLDWVRSANRKISAVLMLYLLVAVCYEALLLTINAVLAAQSGAQTTYVIVLALVCLLPALSAVLFARQRIEAQAQLEAEQKKAEDLREKIRQEVRQDRKEARELKLRYASETKAPEDKPFPRKRA